MPKLISLSGHEIECGVDDYALAKLACVKARPLMSNIEGEKIIGGENAVMIKRALAEAGLKIVEVDHA